VAASSCGVARVQLSAGQDGYAEEEGRPKRRHLLAPSRSAQDMCSRAGAVLAGISGFSTLFTILLCKQITPAGPL